MSSQHTVRVRGEAVPLPVGKIIALGRNYGEHAREMGAAAGAAPLLFLKPASALVASGGVVRYPDYSNLMHHEVELVVAIGRGGARLTVEEAPGYVLGYGVGLDLTLRDLQAVAKQRGQPWAVAKGFDGSAPVSEIVPAGEVPTPSELTLELRVNGDLRQQGRASAMILPVPATIAYVSRHFSLDRGDLIFTGTPAGVGPVEPGDRLEAELVGHARLEVTVEAAATAGAGARGA